MRSVCSIVAVTLAAMFITRPACPAVQFTYNSFDVAGAYSTYATGVNSAGDVVGYWENGPASSSSTVTQAFLFRHGTSSPIIISFSGSTSTRLWAIDDTNPAKLYGSYVDSSNSTHLFSYTYVSGSGTNITGTVIPFSVPTGASSNSTITGMNSAGTAVGYYSTSSGTVAFQSSVTGTRTTLTYPIQTSAQVYPRGINASGQIVLSTQYASNNEQFLFNNGQFTGLENIVSAVTGIGPAGQILGTSADNSGFQHGTIYQSLVSTFLIYSNALLDSAYNAYLIPKGMNASSQTVGYYYDTSVRIHGFIASPPVTVSGGKTILINSPAAQARVSGRVPVVGWAGSTSSTQTIQAVTIQVDGSFIGNAAYGVSRPDVCPSNQTYTSCPNVGLTFSLDTGLLTDGAHTLQAVATANDGSHISTSVPFTVANASAPTDPMPVSIDFPRAGNNTLRGTAVFSGWAFDVNSPMQSVQIYVDTNVSFLAAFFPGSPAIYGGSRPDVCAAFPGQPNCLTSGWSYALNTTSFSNGVHTMTAVFTANNGDRKTFNVSFTVANTNQQLIAGVDQPTSATPVSGSVTVSGWAVDFHLPVGNLNVLVDGTPAYGTAAFAFIGGYRPDICTTYQTALDCPNVGWSTLLDTTQLANGPHTISISAVSQFDPSTFNYDSITTSPVAFTVNNTAPVGPILNLDQPSSPSQTFSARAVISGWAVDTYQPVQKILISVDGTQIGVTQPSINRPDVCNVFPARPGCPVVGWSYDLDTTVLSNGVHTLSITAMTGLGTEATNSVPFTVQNQNGPLSTIIAIDSPGPTTPALAGSVYFSGWAINQDTSIGKVATAIDGAPFLPAATGGIRTDVCHVFPDVQDCPNVGWSLPVDTTLFANGVHRLDVTASIQNSLPGNSQNGSASSYFTINNNLSSSPFLIAIDTPTASTRSLFGTGNFSGWAIRQSPNAVSSVTVSVDGAFFGTASYGGSRPDVCTAFRNASPSYNVCPNGQVGWSFAVDTTVLANGSHTLSVTATSADGLHETMASSFTVAN